MVKNDKTIICSFRCLVPMIEDNSEHIEIEMLIVSKDGKYGLEYIIESCVDEIDNVGLNSRTIIQCVNDNLFCDSLGHCSYLIVVNEGKQGLITLQAKEIRGGFMVITKEIFPCVYDQIINCPDTPSIILLYQAGKVLYYDICKKICCGPFDAIQGLYCNVFGCWKGNQQQIRCSDEEIEFYHPELGWKYDFLCRYDNGSVFKVSKIDKTIDDLEGRLVFYSEDEQKVYYTGIYEQISIFALDDGYSCFKATEIHLINNNEIRKIVATKIFVDDSDIMRFKNEEAE